jgi:Trk-type K+ transport system membrane component
MSGIMYGISTAYNIPYIDCLFNCMSAMTVTGLATVNLSTLSALQQVILFVQMTIGSLVCPLVHPLSIIEGH